MKFRFTRHGLRGRPLVIQRALEIVPGAISWTVLIGMLALSCWRPLVAAVLIIAFVLYWLFRLFYITLFLIVSYGRLAIERDTDWMARVRGLDDPGRALASLRPRGRGASFGRRLSEWIYRRQLEEATRRSGPLPRSEEIVQLVIFPVASELPEILDASLRSLARQAFPTKRLLVILAVEARAPQAVQQGARQIQQAYRQQFMDLLVTHHPSDLSGEARVKGANATFAAKTAAVYVRDRGIRFDQVIVSCFDADTVVEPGYFSHLTYRFLLCPTRSRASFQPIPVFHNNIWDAPEFIRVLDIGSSFFQFVEATNPEKLVTFSSHSMSFQALVEVGYWPVDLISDDSAIFWKAFIHYDGDYRVVPLYVTVSMDAVNAGSWWKTVVNVYRQKRRWAWGVENFPIVTRAFLQARRIPPWTRLRHAFKLLESHVAWASWAFLLTLISWLPAVFANREFSDSMLYYSGPRITGVIFHLSALALVVTIVLSLALLPPPSGRHRMLRRIGHAVEWLSIPLVATLLSALPALDAQTRLMFGRYMEFWVTPKARG